MRFGQPAILLAALLVGVPDSARAGAGPICRRDDVLTFVANQIEGTEAQARVLRDSSAETPMPGGSVVACSVSVQFRRFDTARQGAVPLVTIEVRRFFVKQVPGGFVVTFAE